jgi:hypothetical protein
LLNAFDFFSFYHLLEKHVSLLFWEYLMGELAIGQEGVIPVEDGERSDLDR